MVLFYVILFWLVGWLDGWLVGRLVGWLYSRNVVGDKPQYVVLTGLKLRDPPATLKQSIYFSFMCLSCLYMCVTCMPSALRTSDALEIRITGSYRNQTRSPARAARTPTCQASSLASKRKLLLYCFGLGR